MQCEMLLFSSSVSHLPIRAVCPEVAAVSLPVFAPPRFQVGDLVLIILDERHDNYVLFTVGPTLYFLHSESLAALDLKPGTLSAPLASVSACATKRAVAVAPRPASRDGRRQSIPI